MIKRNELIGQSTVRPLSPDALKGKITERVNEYCRGRTTFSARGVHRLRGAARTYLELVFGERRRTILEFFYGITSTRDLTPAQALAVLDWLGFEDSQPTGPTLYAQMEGLQILDRVLGERQRPEKDNAKSPVR